MTSRATYIWLQNPFASLPSVSRGMVNFDVESGFDFIPFLLHYLPPPLPSIHTQSRTFPDLIFSPRV